MWYLFGQVWLLLLIAFAAGWLAHWLLCCRSKKTESQSLPPVALSSSGVSTNSVVATEIAKGSLPAKGSQPKGFSERPAQVDDLKRIKGVGAVIEATLNTIGIYQFNQIAEWGEDNIDWVEKFIAFPGRIHRENWVQQAKTLAHGGATEFSQRVDKGELEY